MNEKKFEYESWDIKDTFTNHLFEIKNDTKVNSLSSLFPIFYEMCDFISNRLTQIEGFYDSPSMKNTFSFYAKYEKFIYKLRLLEVGDESKEEQKLKKEFDTTQLFLKENADDILSFFDVFKSVDINLKICTLTFEKKIEELERNLFSDTNNKKNMLLLIKELKKSYKKANVTIEILLERNATLANKIVSISDFIK